MRPGLDDKILTAWNALMIGALARVAREADSSTDGDSPALRQQVFALAGNALAYLHAQVWRDGRLFAKAGADGARFPAYLDDHAFLLEAIIEYLQCEWSDADLGWAVALADALLERFEDRGHGGFFFTAHDHETLIQRPKPWGDEAVPSGNGVAARALLRLGHLLGETRYLDAAERTLRAAYATMQQMPQGCATLQRALHDFLSPRAHVVVRCGSATEAQAWRDALRGRVDRRTDVYLIAAVAAGSIGMLSAQKYSAGGTAYLCRGTRCEPPIDDPGRLADALGAPVRRQGRRYSSTGRSGSSFCGRPAGGKVRREQVADARDGVDCARDEITGGETFAHRGADRDPFRLGHARCDAAVRDDLYRMVGDKQIDQDAGIVLRVPDPQVRECLVRALAGAVPAHDARERQRALDREAHLFAVALLAIGDRLLDAVERGRGKQPPCRAAGNEMCRDAGEVHAFILTSSPRRRRLRSHRRPR